ncbi:MAG: DinB/UmuC family translesion DNA polymerase [Planctomycetota bacterium]
MSHDTTFERDAEVPRAWLSDLTEQVGWRLRHHQLRGRTITRSQTLSEATNVTQELTGRVLQPPAASLRDP